MLKSLVNLAAAAAFALTAGPALAQIQTIDPNDADSYQPAAGPGFEEPAYEDPAPSSEWSPVDQEAQGSEALANDAEAAPAADPAAQPAAVPREDVFTAAEDVFGRGAEGLAGLLERILREQGE